MWWKWYKTALARAAPLHEKTPCATGDSQYFRALIGIFGWTMPGQTPKRTSD
jgi:hypothetical protein